jgi:hypothetical protein
MRILIIATATLLSFAPAYAQQCAGFADRKSFGDLNVAQVKPGQARVAFLKEDCTSTKAGACQSKAFVMPGDVVLVGQVFDVSACAAFVNAKGQMTTGLLPNERLQLPTSPSKTIATALVGTWTRSEAEIVIKPKGRDGVLSFAGDATYGALDKGRVARGAVNLGEFSFDWKPGGHSIDVTIDGSEAKARGTLGDDNTGCAVAMIALGPYLAVEDNRNCGGVNVSFTGIYRRGR